MGDECGVKPVVGKEQGGEVKHSEHYHRQILPKADEGPNCPGDDLENNRSIVLMSGLLVLIGHLFGVDKPWMPEAGS